MPFASRTATSNRPHSVDPAAPSAPVIVDLIDFSTANDGDTVTARYAPESGGRYERDCFAVTVIAEELLGGEIDFQDFLSGARSD